MTRRRLGLVCLCLLIVVAVAPRAWPQAPAVDPKGLIGQWSGSWVNSHVASTNGKYYLTIERVVGDKVFGKGEFWARTTTEFKVVGTLSGNQLTFGRTTLTVDGNQMQGTGPDFKISLIKDK
jgi:hypothetical protein